MNILKLTDEQLDVVYQALELYTRIGIGQFQVIKDHPTFLNSIKDASMGEDKKTDYEKYHNIRKDIDLKLHTARNLLINNNLPLNGSWGISNEKVDNSCRVAYDISQVIRHERWKASEEKSFVTVDSAVTFFNDKDNTSNLIECKLGNKKY